VISIVMTGMGHLLLPISDSSIARPLAFDNAPMAKTSAGTSVEELARQDPLQKTLSRLRSSFRAADREACPSVLFARIGIEPATGGDDSGREVHHGQMSRPHRAFEPLIRLATDR
jgi:hypothetical protein